MVPSGAITRIPSAFRSITPWNRDSLASRARRWAARSVACAETCSMVSPGPVRQSRSMRSCAIQERFFHVLELAEGHVTQVSRHDSEYGAEWLVDMEPVFIDCEFANILVM